MSKLYHYTSLESFINIWATQTLIFSPQSRLNDINELSKFYYDDDQNDVKYEVERYKQISLITSSEKYSGCMSTVMWGHYGNKGQGICIEFDKEKLLENCTSKMLCGSVIYTDVEPINVETNKSAKSFVIGSKKPIFFTKTKEWEYEQEYRIVSKDEKSLSIKGAVSAIIITTIFGGDVNNTDTGGLRSNQYNILKNIIDDSDIKIWEFNPIGLGGSNDNLLRDENSENRIPFNSELELDIN